MPYHYQLRIQRHVRRAIVAGAAAFGLFLLLALPERMLGWSGLGAGTPAVLEVFELPQMIVAQKPVAALRIPPGLGHLAFPAYAEWTEATEESCVDCDWNLSYGVESVVDAIDVEALGQLERSTSTERTADASYVSSGFRGLAGGSGGFGGSGLTGGGSSLGAAANAEGDTNSQAAAAPLAEEASEAATTETSETVAEAGGAPAGSWSGSSAGAVKESDPAAPPSSVSNAPPSLLTSVGSQPQGASAGGPDNAWTLVEAGVIDPLATAGSNPFYTGPDPRNVPPPAAPEPPATPQPPTAAPEPPVAGDEPPIAADEPPITPNTPGVPDTPITPTEPDTPASPVPEPTQLILMGIALSAVVYRMRRG